jgi:hypothetical protein
MPKLFDDLELSDDDVLEPPKKVAKPKKHKKEITPERRAQLLENLKKGRETSMRNRQKKGQAKKILKKKGDQLIDNILRKELDDRDDFLHMQDELERLREIIKNQNNVISQNEKKVMSPVDEVEFELGDASNDVIDETNEIDEIVAPPIRTVREVVREPSPPPTVLPVIPPPPPVNTYAEQLANGMRPTFSNKDIINDQLMLRKNRNYKGTIQSRFLNF